MLTLDTDITKINRVGATTAKRFNSLGISTARDLLLYYPYRYEDFRTPAPIGGLSSGQSANVVGQIEHIHGRRSFRRRLSVTEAIVNDGTDSLRVIWFNQPFIARSLAVGDRVSLAGKIEGDYGGFIMKSPVYEKITAGEGLHTQGLVPDYHLTLGLTQKQIRFLVKEVIGLADKFPDYLPPEIVRGGNLLSFDETLKKIHFPDDFDDIERAKKRLAWDELFLVQTRSQLARRELMLTRAKAVKFREKDTKTFVDSLPFRLTDDQKKAAWAILNDMEKTEPMARLLEGDVGSGKTLVAVIAMLNAALNKKQSVLMVPTEILAHQHFYSISKLLENFNIIIGLITRTEKNLSKTQDTRHKIQKNSKLQNPKSKITSQNIINQADIIIGTHSLIQEKTEFNDLSLVIIDEQHRFGVDQRARLLAQGSAQTDVSPHFLSMTATPIPRSLALAIFGDLNLSVIREMPKGRKPITTKVVPEEKREAAYKFIRDQVKEGRQVFVICPLIDPSDKLGVKSVKEEFEKLDKTIFPDLPVGLLHGRLKPKEKEKIMADFLDKTTKILVSTSVVEVGVDVPNATIMMIEGADRFGLAQLHQFRGRVGRGEHQSYCFLFAESRALRTAQRLKAMEKYSSGFDLAKVDLKFRGPGEIYGTIQKGFPEFRIASLFDHDLIEKTSQAAAALIKKDPELKEYPELKAKLGEYEKRVHLE
ncbi:MAG: ATP-dependent DNA helicase RecG [Candidatus Falkowbacteria bacterium]